MNHLKLGVVIGFGLLMLATCAKPEKKPFVIAESKTYEASLFRQNCAICHGTEGKGRTLGNGLVVPSLREGQLKALTEKAIADQIANGGNGMVPFKNILSQREIDMMTRFVYHDLRGN